MKKLLTSTASLLFVAATALGHGSMADPISRTYQGFLENPQTPQSNAVLAAISVGGTQAFYDWNEVSRNILDYNYQAVIPDGQIPSAGRTKYAGLNLTRTDWPATMVAISVDRKEGVVNSTGSLSVNILSSYHVFVLIQGS